MAFPIVAAFSLGVIGAVGAKVGTDHVYPWLIKNVDSVKNKLTKVISEARMRRDIIKSMEKTL